MKGNFNTVEMRHYEKLEEHSSNQFCKYEECTSTIAGELDH